MTNINILDEQISLLICIGKGYRITLACMQHGKQMTLQRDFAESDKEFTATQTLSSSSVASYRSGNERGVRLSKQSGFVRQGKTGNSIAVILDDAWMVW